MPDEQVQVSRGVPFALYDAFTSVPYSGSQAGILLQASSIDVSQRQKIAREIGSPATAFVESVVDGHIKLQFFSTVMELPMCGHGTICLITRLIETGLLEAPDAGLKSVVLDLPNGSATVEYRYNKERRCEIMLDVEPAKFSLNGQDLSELVGLLGVDLEDLSPQYPVEMACADFIHLCLPLRDLSAMRKLSPDFTGLASYCRENGLETVATFSASTKNPDLDLHVRDFCPAVGVAESAAAGTTNAALAAYALRHGIVKCDDLGVAKVRAEQGIEIGRPSEIKTRIETNGGRVSRIQVGGVATRVFEGTLDIAIGDTP